MAYALYLYRIARSCESLEAVGRCLSHLRRQAPGLQIQRRFLSTSEDPDAGPDHGKGVRAGASDQKDGGTVDNVRQSPFVEAHLASLSAQSPESKDKRAPTESQDASSTPEILPDQSARREGDEAMGQQVAPAIPMFIFDDSTVARVPGEEAAAQKPWDAAREAELFQAEAAMKAGRARRGAQADAVASEQPSAQPEAQFRTPVKYDELPKELRPRFQEVRRRRPPPMRIADVWQALRDSDHLGHRAKKSGFVSSVDCSISLLIDPRRSDQLIRGTATLPHGTGRDARVVVFTSNPGDADAAAAAGAAVVGGDDLVAQVARDKGLAADTVVATPDMVPRLGKIARILGPKGLMPNPKFGTVTTQVADTVQELRRGKLQFRNDKGGTVSVSIGRRSFSDAALADNFFAFLRAVMDLRPKGLSGSGVTGYIERVSLSTTRGKGFPVHAEDLTAAAREAHAQQ